MPEEPKLLRGLWIVCVEIGVSLLHLHQECLSDLFLRCFPGYTQLRVKTRSTYGCCLMKRSETADDSKWSASR